jgi:hypothetical protein
MCHMNNATKIAQYLIGSVGILMFCGSLMLATAPGAANATASIAAPMNTGMVNPAAVLDTSRVDDLRPVSTDTAADDAAAEGTDVLPIAFRDAPEALWYTLNQQHPEWYDDDVAGIGTFWVPIGTVLHDDAGLYMATYDGWGQCEDFVTVEGTCVRPDGTVALEMLNVTPLSAAVIYGADELARCSTDAQCAALDADRARAGLDELDGPAYGTEQA